MNSESKSKAWDLGLLLVGAILPPALALFWGSMKKDLTVPVWAVLSYSLVFALLFYFVLRRSEVDSQRQREEHSRSLATVQAEHDKLFEKESGYARDQIETLRSELRDREEDCSLLSSELSEMKRVVFEDGLYYYATDVARSQPFCRLCRDSSGKLVTVQVYDARDSYWCPECNYQNAVRVVPQDG